MVFPTDKGMLVFERLRMVGSGLVLGALYQNWLIIEPFVKRKR
jgi:hypothetical protein